jgi:hypothetical protein
MKWWVQGSPEDVLRELELELLEGQGNPEAVTYFESESPTCLRISNFNFVISVI